MDFTLEGKVEIDAGNCAIEGLAAELNHKSMQIAVAGIVKVGT